ncbi:Rab family GTPase [Marinomonas aquiplantarum]|uniref:Small GTP-binding protein n=1 Tax=Marinomonas aquiplantarum TaxID=491951 RepID=A0A366D217_9GAMM|nr:Rab family GTPase [Marinomonas aquiplantarum]RBO84127.1 small GTP-binding protein [Marinomonas aquiplantarum]
MIQKKICMLGASAVGKTSLVKQYVEGIFSDRYLTSIGVKIDKKVVDVGDSSVQLMLWDIEGVDRYAGFNPKYLRGSAAAIVVVDQTRPQSLLDGLEICRMIKAEKDVPVVMVINKSDLPKADGWDGVAENDGLAMIEANFQTSAKTGEGVENMFLAIAELALKTKVG